MEDARVTAEKALARITDERSHEIQQKENYFARTLCEVRDKVNFCYTTLSVFSATACGHFLV